MGKCGIFRRPSVNENTLPRSKALFLYPSIIIFNFFIDFTTVSVDQSSAKGGPTVYSFNVIVNLFTHVGGIVTSRTNVMFYCKYINLFERIIVLSFVHFRPLSRL